MAATFGQPAAGQHLGLAVDVVEHHAADAQRGIGARVVAVAGAACRAAPTSSRSTVRRSRARRCGPGCPSGSACATPPWARRADPAGRGRRRSAAHAARQSCRRAARARWPRDHRHTLAACGHRAQQIATFSECFQIGVERLQGRPLAGQRQHHGRPLARAAARRFAAAPGRRCHAPALGSRLRHRAGLGAAARGRPGRLSA